MKSRLKFVAIPLLVLPFALTSCVASGDGQTPFWGTGTQNAANSDSINNDGGNTNQSTSEGGKDQGRGNSSGGTQGSSSDGNGSSSNSENIPDDQKTLANGWYGGMRAEEYAQKNNLTYKDGQFYSKDEPENYDMGEVGTKVDGDSETSEVKVVYGNNSERSALAKTEAKLSEAIKSKDWKEACKYVAYYPVVHQGKSCVETASDLLFESMDPASKDAILTKKSETTMEMTVKNGVLGVNGSNFYELIDGMWKRVV